MPNDNSAPDREYPLTFRVAGDELVGIVHGIEAVARIGVLVIVGGPQYRVGSHRQFVLLARALASSNIPVFRFDYRGIGDSSGQPRNFQLVDEDIGAAVDALTTSLKLDEVVIWGLCDAASAALMYAHRDPRVVGLVLLNPWVHSPRTEAKVRLRTYYVSRLRSRDFWHKLLRLRVDWRDAARSLWRYAFSAGRRENTASPSVQFIERMRHGWENFGGSTLLFLSGDDLTAAEFAQLGSESPDWRSLLASKLVRTITLSEANHTFARADWRSTVERETIAWIKELNRSRGRAC